MIKTAPRIAVDGRQDLLGSGDVVEGLWDALEAGLLGSPERGTTYTLKGFPVAFVYDEFEMFGFKSIVRDLELASILEHYQEGSQQLVGIMRGQLNLWALPVSDREIRIACGLGENLYPTAEF